MAETQRSPGQSRTGEERGKMGLTYRAQFHLYLVFQTLNLSKCRPTLIDSLEKCRMQNTETRGSLSGVHPGEYKGVYIPKPAINLLIKK